MQRQQYRNTLLAVQNTNETQLQVNIFPPLSSNLTSPQSLQPTKIDNNLIPQNFRVLNQAFDVILTQHHKIEGSPMTQNRTPQETT